MENSWNKKKIPQNQYHIIHAEAPDPSADQVTTPMLHRHNSPVTSQHWAADIILYNVSFPITLQHKAAVSMMSLFPDFCSDIFLLHIIYNFFCLFCLHYTVINLLYRKFTYKRYLFFTDLLFVVLFSLYSKSNCCHTVHIDIYFTNLLFFYVFY